MAYTYTIEYATRSQAVTPKTIGSVVVAKEDGEAFFREKLSGSVVLNNEDYIFLLDAEKYAVQCCQEIRFTIVRTCSAGSEIFWKGYFTLYDVEWDHDNQEATIKKVNVKDEYNVVFANWHKEINWFGDIPKRRPAAAYTPNHPLQPFTQTIITSADYNPTGSNYFPRGFYFNYAILWLVQQTMKDTGSEDYADITEEQMSSFLTDTTNPVTGKANYLPDVIMMHISDAKRPGASNPAWKGIVTLRDVLANLKQLYNAYWYIDDSGHFRIEHISYFRNFSYTSPGVTLDLTQDSFKKKMEGKLKFSWNAEDLKGREGVEQTMSLAGQDADSTIWTLFAGPSSPEFAASYMIYEENCVPKNDKGESGESYQTISLFTTDWLTVVNKPDVMPEDGWVLVYVPIVNAENAVAYGWCPIDGEQWINGNLAMTRLFYEFGRTELSFSYGKMSFEKETEKKDIDSENSYISRPMRAKSTKQVKILEPVELDMCCGDEYNFSGIIKHPLADVSSAQKIEYDLSTEVVTLSLIASNTCDDIPFPEYEEPTEPNPECPEEGKLLRSDLTDVYHADTAINYVRIAVYTDYYADGNCGEYSTIREVISTTPKRQNGPR